MRKLLYVLLVACLVTLSACSSGENETVNTEEVSGSSTTASTADVAVTDPVETTVPQETNVSTELSAEEVYNSFLFELCEELRDIIVDDTHLDSFSYREGMLGVSEIASHGGVDMLKKMGYSIQDLDRDGISELIISQVDDFAQEVCTGSRILCTFTFVDGEMVLLFEGNSRNRYYLLDDNSIYNEGSNGAASHGFGIYQISDNQRSISCNDFYFVDMINEDEGVRYHNQTGEYDIAVSEILDNDIAAHDQMQSDFAIRIQGLILTSLDSVEG